MAHVVDLEEDVGPAYRCVGDVSAAGRGDPGESGAAHPEAPGAELVVLVEADRDRAREDVGLFVGVLAEHLGKLLGERGAVLREPLVVCRRELDMEVVGHQAPVAREDLRGVVDLALESGGYLDRLDLAAEGASEGTGDHRLQPVLEPLKDSHATSSLAVGGAPGSSVARTHQPWAHPYRGRGPRSRYAQLLRS